MSIDRVLHVRYEAADGSCGDRQVSVSGHCYHEGRPGSQLHVLREDGWRDREWARGEYVPTDIAQGETRVGRIGFQFADDVRASEFELCAPIGEESFNPETFPCVPIAAPDSFR